jgi:hypothetical protein
MSSRDCGTFVSIRQCERDAEPGHPLDVLVVSPPCDVRAVIDDILVLTSSLRTEGQSLAAVSSLAGIIGFRRVSGVESQ